LLVLLLFVVDDIAVVVAAATMVVEISVVADPGSCGSDDAVVVVSRVKLNLLLEV
jgi:hypothetical protein